MRNTTRGTVLAERARVAATPLTRLRGLLGTVELPRQHGLIIRPCRQVHSFLMRYALDLVFFDRSAHVVRTLEQFVPSRISPFVAAAAAVLELPAGTLAESPALPGDVLRIEERASPPA